MHISGDCVACGSCVVVCPHGAVADGYLTSADFYQITAACTACGLCLGVCPTGAIEE